MMTPTPNRSTQRHASRALLVIVACGALAACSDRGEPARSSSGKGSKGTLSTSTATLPPATAEKPTSAPSSQGKIDTTLPAPTLGEAKVAYREGIAFYESRQFVDAASRFEIASLGRPDHSYTHYMHGLSLWKSGRVSEAERALETSARLDPSAIRTWINLARVRMELGNPLGALEAAEAATALDPGSSDGLHQQGRALAAIGRGEEALDALQHAREASPDNGYIANTLGWLLIQRGDPAAAVPHLESARERLPDVAYVRNNLGVAYERGGQLDKAADEYRAAVELGDSGGRAAASLARIQPLIPRETVRASEDDSRAQVAIRDLVDPRRDGTANEPKR